MKKLVILLLFLIALGAGIWLARPRYQHWKETRFLGQARAAFTKGDDREAAFIARKVLEINPASADACKLMAQLAERARSPQAVAWRARVVELQPDAATNRLELARAALLFGNPPAADKALRGIKEPDRDNVDFQTLAAMLALAQNNPREAESHCEQAVRLDPQNKFAVLNLAVLHLQSTNEATRAAAVQSLEALCGDPAHRDDALRNLTGDALNRRDFARAEKYSQSLVAGTNAAFADRLLRLLVLKESGSTEMSGWLAALESGAARDWNQLSVLGEWLRAHRMSDEALSWLRSLPEKTRSDRAAVELAAECYADRGDWARMENALENQNWGELEFIRLAQLSHAQREQNEKLASKSDWDQAVNAASGKIKAMNALLDLAAEWRWENEREELAWRILQQFPQERGLLKMLEAMYSASGDTRGLQKVYAALMKYDSPDPVAKNNFAAVSLLLNSQVDEAREIARANCESHPQDPVIASTYAFALHLQGRSADGLKLLERFPPAQLRRPEVAVYYGVLLASTGRTNAAREFLSAAAASTHLLPEEKNLIKNSLAALPQPGD